MAADVWKVQDHFGRIYYYENENKFQKAYKKRLIEAQWAKRSFDQNGGKLPEWYRECEGYRIINDAWVKQEFDAVELAKHLNKLEAKNLLKRGW